MQVEEVSRDCKAKMTNKDVDFPSNLEDSLENVIKKEGFIQYSVSKKLISTDGGNFLGKPYVVTVKGRTKEGEKLMDIFVKSIIDDENLESTFNLPQAYAAEAFIYNELSKIFSALQDEAGIPPAERYKVIKSYDVSNTEGIFLDNVTVQGYKSCSRLYTMSVEVARSALTEIAKFHALSFAVKEKMPEYFKRKIETIKGPFTFNNESEKSYLNMANIATKHLQDGSKEKLEKFLPKAAEKWRHYQVDRCTKCCLCHGDFRLNNLLMKHEDGVLTDLYLIDYQLVYYGCPINDLIYFMFTGTDQDFRRQHLDHLKEFYYDTFNKFLKNFQLDSKDIYPRKEFDSDFKQRLDLGLIYGLYFLPFFLAADEHIPSLSEEAVEDMQFVLHECFVERMEGIIEDFVEWGYL